MKHRFENGKWMPENGTFVHVPNEQIPEVIQLLRDNGQVIGETLFLETDSIVNYFSGEWYTSSGESSMDRFELPFPDFTKPSLPASFLNPGAFSVQRKV